MGFWAMWRKRRAAKLAERDFRLRYFAAVANTDHQARQISGLELRLKIARARIAELEAGQKAEDGEQSPGLRPPEIERLARLLEECGETAQAAAKVLLYGWEGESPWSGRPHRVALEQGVGGMRAAANLLLDVGDVRLNEVQSWQRKKKARLATEN
jgi:hypothetical protein